MIKKFVKKNNIDLSQYEGKKYTSYNDFFTRRILPEKRPISYDKEVFISPCDSKLSAYKINCKSLFNIKNSLYTVKDLLNNNELSKEFNNGLCLIFRLSVDDYHRYCYVDDGYKENGVFIPGKLHTVQPIALSKYKVYSKNSREYTILHTKEFGDIIQIEVGALLIGKIKNFHEENYTFTKGEEKGMFEFGGSTIVVLVKENALNIDEEILENTKLGKETIVKYGEGIGVKNV